VPPAREFCLHNDPARRAVFLHDPFKKLERRSFVSLRQFNRHGEAFDMGETFSGVPYEAGLSAVAALRPFVPKGTTITQFALRWILMNEAISVVIPGAKNAGAGAQQYRRSGAFVTCTRRDGAHSIDLRNGRQAIGAPAMVKAQG
jgi:hypothetical protein